MEVTGMAEDVLQRPSAGGEYDVDIVQIYLDDISQYPLLTKAEEVQLSKRVQAGIAARDVYIEHPDDPEIFNTINDGKAAKDLFVNSNLRLVVSIARKFRQSNVLLLDLIQEGNLGLEHAVDKFDWQKGFKFSTYATWWIRQYIDRSIANTRDTIRIPVHVSEDISRLGRLEKSGLDEATIADYMGMDHAQLSQLRQWSSLQPVSYNLIIGDDGYELLDTLRDFEGGAEYEKVEDGIIRDGLDAILGKVLTPREKQVISLRYGLGSGEPMSLEAVGALVGEEGKKITRERVRQVEHTALVKLKHPALHREMVGVFPITDDETSWQQRAACAGSAAIMLAVKENRGRPAKNYHNEKDEIDRRIKNFCDNCPVVGECRELARQVKPGGGVWGGVRYKSRG
jgi:RNA polymerase sigma factor (sigma-70 family)